MSEKNPSGKSIMPSNPIPEIKRNETVSAVSLSTGNNCSTKGTGNNGHFYECENCTYHLFCLNPPLERVPEGKWFCPKCTRANFFIHPRGRRSKRVMKKSDPEKLTIHVNSMLKTPSTHDNLPNEPQPCSSRRPILIRLKIGSTTVILGSSKNSKEKKPVKSENSDSMKRKKKSTEDDDKGSDMMSTGDINKGSNDNRSNLKKFELVYYRKRQKYQPDSTQTSSKEEKSNGVFTSKNNQKILAESVHQSTGLENEGSRDCETSYGAVIESIEDKYEYSPAGRARKEKYATLRARQKERVSRRHVVVPAPYVPGIQEPQASRNTTISSHKDENTTVIVRPTEPNPLSSTEPVAFPDQGLGYSPPVLPSKRPFVPHSLRQPRPNRREALSQQSSFPVFAEPSLHAKPSTNGQQSFEPCAGPSTSFPLFQEKSGLSTMNLNDFRSNNTSRLALTRRPTYLSPTVSLRQSQLGNRQSVPDMSTRLAPNIPSIPNFPFSENPNLPVSLPMVKFDHSLPPRQSLPENQKKGNILFLAESDNNELLKEMRNPFAWSEKELDSLWIGVRRYGYGNWDAMLRDPRLTFSQYKNPVEFTAKWQQEQRRFFYGSGLSLSKASNNPGFFDEMMAPLYKTRVSDIGMEAPPPRSPSRPTNIQLGIGGKYFELHPSHKTFVSGSSAACDAAPKHSAGFFSRTSSNNNESAGNIGADSVKLNNLPHWLRDVFSVSQPPLHPTAGPILPPATSDAARSPNPLYGAENSAGAVATSELQGTQTEFGLQIGGAKASAGAGAATTPKESKKEVPEKSEKRIRNTDQAADLVSK